MRYRIVHLIEGEAKEYLDNLSRAVSSVFRLRPPTLNIEAHLTIKSPFDVLSTDLFDVERILDRYAKAHSPVPYTLKGFSSFDNRVVYMDVEAPEETHTLFTNLKDELKQLMWLDFKPHEEETKLHATLCYPRTPEQTKQLLEKLIERGGRSFDCKLNKIALMKKGERAWEIYKEYTLGSSGFEPLKFTEI